MTPKFAIGDTFKTRGKHPRHCTILDIRRTYSQASGELVKISYVATHEFGNRIIVDHDVCETTVAMGRAA